jgi:hypothetical protein
MRLGSRGLVYLMPPGLDLRRLGIADHKAVQTARRALAALGAGTRPRRARFTARRCRSPARCRYRCSRRTYRPESVAQALVECAVRPRAEVMVGSGAAALALTAAVARPLADLILATYRPSARDAEARRGRC